MTLEIHRQSVGRVVAAGAVFLQTLHHDPVQIALELVNQLGFVSRAPFGRRGQFLAFERREPRAGPRRLLLADRLAHRVDALRHQLLFIKRRAARQQFVKQHAQAVDVAARVNVQSAHLRLLRTHVGRRADELMQLRIDRRVRQPAFRRLGDAEINHLGHRHAVMQRDEDVRRLDVAMDDPFLVRVLDGLADLDEQVEPFLGGEIILVAVVGDADAAHQFHHEIRPAQSRCVPRIEHLGDVGMIHHRQRLPFRLEARDDLPWCPCPA